MITITFTGSVGIGKTTIARTIHRFLTTIGYTSRYIDSKHIIEIDILGDVLKDKEAIKEEIEFLVKHFPKNLSCTNHHKDEIKLNGLLKKYSKI